MFPIPPPPSDFSPKETSYHSLPDFDSVKSETELMTDCLVRTGLYFHWLQRRGGAEGIDKGRISAAMSEAASKIRTVYEKCQSGSYLPEGEGSSWDLSAHQLPVPVKPYAKIARFLLHLEEGSLSKEALASEFHSLNLDRQSVKFLSKHLGTSLGQTSELATEAMFQDPRLLLQIQNDQHENIVEVLLDRLEQRDSITAELERINKVIRSWRTNEDEPYNILRDSPYHEVFFRCLEKITPETKPVSEEDFNENPRDYLEFLSHQLSILRRPGDAFVRAEGQGREKQGLMVEFAKAYVEQKGELTDSCTESFGIDSWNEPTRSEFAQFLAQQPSGESNLFYFLNRFPIAGENDRFKIAQEYAQLNGAAMAYNLNLFGIEDEQDLIEIAKLCAEESGESTWLCLDMFGITNSEALFSIKILCLMDVLSKGFNPGGSPISGEVKELMSEVFSGDIEGKLSGFYPERKPKKAGEGPQGNPILTQLKKEKAACEGALEGSPLTLKYRLDYLLALYVGIESSHLRAPEAAGAAGETAGVDSETQATLEKILKIRNKPLQIYLISVLMKVTADSHLQANFISLAESGGSKRVPIGFEYARPILLIAAHCFQNVKKGELERAKPLIQGVMTKFKDKIKDSKRYTLNKTCLTTLKALEGARLPAKDRLHLFTQICKLASNRKDAADFEKNLKYLKLLCEGGFFSAELLAPFNGEFAFKDLEKACITTAKTALFGREDIPADIEELLKSRYLKLTAEQRRPLALELYASRIRALNYPSFSEALSRFLKGVLGESFKHNRYDVSLSPHLQIIQASFPDLWEAWQSLPPSTELLSAREAAEPAPGEVGGGREQENGSLEVSITDDWQDLFLCGTEVSGSCISIDDENFFCLLGYCLDGKIQMVAVKDKETGEIRSRAILKLLLPQEGGKPVLFLEDIYPTSCSKDQEEALKAMALQRARELGIDLYSSHTFSFPADAPLVSLESKGCPAPVEYEDGRKDSGVDGVVENGVYTISAHRVIVPSI